MIYSKTCEYAVRALAHLASKKPNTYLGASDLSEATGVPGPYVSKIFQNLARKGILKSRRGASGGFAMERDPASLKLIEIIEAVDHFDEFNECLMGLHVCEDNNPCPLHDIWKSSKHQILQRCLDVTLSDLSKNEKALKYRELKRVRLNTAAV